MKESSVSLISCRSTDTTDDKAAECVTPSALARQNGVLRASAILDILTDAFCESALSNIETILTYCNSDVCSGPAVMERPDHPSEKAHLRRDPLPEHIHDPHRHHQSLYG